MPDRSSVVFVVLLACFLVAGSPGIIPEISAAAFQASARELQYEPGELLVRFRSNVQGDVMGSVLRQNGARKAMRAARALRPGKI